MIPALGLLGSLKHWLDGHKAAARVLHQVGARRRLEAGLVLAHVGEAGLVDQAVADGPDVGDV